MISQTSAAAMGSAIDSILALDAASKTGWAFLDVDGSICSGRKDFSRAGSHGAVFHLFRRWLDETVNELAPAVLAYEVPSIGMANRVSGNTSRLLLGGLYGVTLGYAKAQHIACVEIAPSEAKKAVTGKGNAAKATVRQQVQTLGHAVESDDEADAVAVLLAACARLGIASRRAA